MWARCSYTKGPPARLHAPRGLSHPSRLEDSDATFSLHLVALGGNVLGTLAQDDAYDRARGIREGSPRDNALDRKRGVPLKPAPKKGK